MKFRTVLLAVIFGLQASALVHAAESLSALGYTSNSSFWADIPHGWYSDATTAQRLGGIFVLVPDNSTFDSASCVITAGSYENTSLDKAMQSDREAILSQDPVAQISSQPPVITAKGKRFTLRETHSKVMKAQPYDLVAFIQLGPDVIVLSYSALKESDFNSQKATFMKVLRTFEDAKL